MFELLTDLIHSVVDAFSHQTMANDLTDHIHGHFIHHNGSDITFGMSEWFDKSQLWGPDALGYWYPTRSDWINGTNKIVLDE